MSSQSLGEADAKYISAAEHEQAIAAKDAEISRLRYDYEIALLVQLERIDENTRLREVLFAERHEPR